MKLVALKIQQRKLGLSDARYRKLLNDIGGGSSSKELPPSAANKVYSTMYQMAEATSPAARYVWGIVGKTSAPSCSQRTQRSLPCRLDQTLCAGIKPVRSV